MELTPILFYLFVALLAIVLLQLRAISLMKKARRRRTTFRPLLKR